MSPYVICTFHTKLMRKEENEWKKNIEKGKLNKACNGANWT